MTRVTNYYSVNGEKLGKKTTGGSRIDYLTDALGSVTATVRQCVSGCIGTQGADICFGRGLLSIPE